MRYRAKRDLQFALPRDPSSRGGDDLYELCPEGTQLVALAVLRPWQFKPFLKREQADPEQRFILAEWNGKERYFEIGADVELTGGRTLGKGRRARRAGDPPPEPSEGARKEERAEEAPEGTGDERSRRKGGRGGRRRTTRS
jgi:hypothetical protein